MSVIHTQTEVVKLELPPEPTVPPITIVGKYFTSPLTEGSNANPSIKVRNDGDAYIYKVWCQYTVDGVQKTSNYIAQLKPHMEDFLYLPFIMPNHDVTIDLAVHAEIVRM